MSVNWTSSLCAVFPRVLELLAADCDRGARHLLTEDRLRWHFIDGLSGAGFVAGRLRTEVRVAGTGPIDLVVDDPASFQIELKFPKDSVAKNAPDTMTMGELLRDFARLAVCPATQECVAIQVIPDRFRSYLERRQDVRWAFDPGEALRLSPGVLASLPRTARAAIGMERLDGTIRARCVYAGRTHDLNLLVYLVDPAEGVLRFKGL